MRRSNSCISFGLLVLFTSGLATPSFAQTDLNSRVDDLLARMTLAEKIGQLNQFGRDRSGLEDAIAGGEAGSIINAATAGETNKLQHVAIERSRLHIPLLFGFDVIHGFRTVFPIPLGLASTWDPATIEQMARLSAEEASASGVRWTFSPMADVARDPRWGRIAEGAGEDPVLGSAMAAAYVRGYQGNESSAALRVAACAKHYAAYGAAEGGRDYNLADMSEARLREIYLPPFKAASDAGAASFMSAFNTLNGVPATANSFLLRQILKGEWGFNGFVISDWHSITELIPHGVAADAKEAARRALLAGVDMDMTSDAYTGQLAGLVREGSVPISLIDDAVRRVLRVKLQLGLFEHPYADELAEAASLLTETTRAAAREIAGKSMVLLRNEGGLLPLSKPPGTIAVIGPLADSKSDMLGPWFGTGVDSEAVTMVEGIRKAAGGTIIYKKGVDISSDSDAGIDDAVEAALQADVVILALGESRGMSGEAASRSALDLPGKQEKLLEAVSATGKKIVLVLMNGRPLSISWASEHVPAILEAWFPGTEGGNAIADVLFGDANPSGRLPVTFPRSAGQIPVYYSHLSTARPPNPYSAGPQTGYIDLPFTPLYPFGYGLSYSQFVYKNAQAGQQPDGDGNLHASVEVTNTGSRAGQETVQLYIREPVSPRARPVLELKQFQKAALEPGETRKVTFTVTSRDLESLQPDMSYAVTPGLYRLAIGPNSAEVIEAQFEVPEPTGTASGPGR